MKVYCKDCKYYYYETVLRSVSRDGFKPSCFIPNGQLNYEGYKLYNKYEASEKNKNNSCLDYKRKWWKIFAPSWKESKGQLGSIKEN